MKKLFIVLLMLVTYSLTALDISVKRADNLQVKTEKIKHNSWSGEFAYEYGIPMYVMFSLTRQETYDNIERKDVFKKDPQNKLNTIINEDYAKSGYDRGHMVDCDSLKYSDEAMKESFYMTNMCPQLPTFNRNGVWREAEKDVENKALEYGKIYSVTGPIIKSKPADMKSLNDAEKVRIPTGFFKVIFVCDEDNEDECIEIIYYLFPDQSDNKKVFKYNNLDTFTKDTGLKIICSH